MLVAIRLAMGAKMVATMGLVLVVPVELVLVVSMV